MAVSETSNLSCWLLLANFKALTKWSVKILGNQNLLASHFNDQAFIRGEGVPKWWGRRNSELSTIQ
jgi:hypothetical protein